MKKLLMVLLAFALVCASAIADAPTTFYDMAISAGYDVSEVVADGEMFTWENIDALTSHGNTIVFSDSSFFQLLMWYQDESPYGVVISNFDGTANMEGLRDLFLNGLTSFDWDVSSYTLQDDDENTVVLNYSPGYQDETGSYFEIYDEYVAAVAAAMGETVAAVQSSVIDPVVEYVTGVLGLSPDSVEQAFAYYNLSMVQNDDGSAVITWTDADKSLAYAVSGDLEDMADVYLKMIPLAPWDICGVFEKGERVLEYDHTENGTSESAATYEEYAAAVNAYFNPAPPADDSPRVRDYVLNTKTKKFHLPSCSSVDQIKKKNRQDYTGTREDLINRGYKPCGNCNP